MPPGFANGSVTIQPGSGSVTGSAYSHFDLVVTICEFDLLALSRLLEYTDRVAEVRCLFFQVIDLVVFSL